MYRILISTYKKQGMAKEDARKQLMAEMRAEEKQMVKQIDEQIEKFWEE